MREIQSNFRQILHTNTMYNRTMYNRTIIL